MGTDHETTTLGALTSSVTLLDAPGAIVSSKSGVKDKISGDVDVKLASDKCRWMTEPERERLRAGVTS